MKVKVIDQRVCAVCGESSMMKDDNIVVCSHDDINTCKNAIKTIPVKEYQRGLNPPLIF